MLRLFWRQRVDTLKQYSKRLMVVYFSEPSSSPVGVFSHVGRSDLAIPAFANGDPLLSYGFIDLFI